MKSNGLIYRPKGRAKEYAAYALNYYDKCTGGCKYCYCDGLWPGFSHGITEEIGTRKAFSFDKLERELKTFKAEPGEYVQLCFAGDPYCAAEEEIHITRTVLGLFLEYRVPTKILSKMGLAVLADLPFFKRFVADGIPLMVGQTLTFLNKEDSAKWEPGGAPPSERVGALSVLHDNGIKTWASFEPVIDPTQTLGLMTAGLKVIDFYAIGKLNHRPEIEKTINWKTFGKGAELMMKTYGKDYYIKADLRRLME